MSSTFPKVRKIPCLFLVLVVAAAPASAQEDAPPTPEELAALGAAAERAPLFATHEPLVMTLSTRIDWLRDERPDEEEADGTVTYVAEDGTAVTVPVEVRTRGNFRREKRNCNFPPLRLDFPRSEMDGTVFEGQNRLKLVTPCHDSRSQFQRYVFQEYLAYRTLLLFTPTAFRVRLVEITYEDTDGEYDTRTKHGFLIEDEDQMAYRNGGLLEELPELHPARMDAQYSTMIAVFQYMIGNTDWSAYQFHNVKLVHTADDRYFTVPYDFDFSGVVNARYATPDPSLGLRSVRQRLFRGFCFPHLVREPLAELFESKRAEIWALYEGFELLDEGDREDALEYFEDFYEVLAEDRRFEREFVRACRG